MPKPDSFRFGDWVEVHETRYFVVYMSKRPVKIDNVIRHKTIIALVKESDAQEAQENPEITRFTFNKEMAGSLPCISLDEVRYLGKADLRKSETVIYHVGDYHGARRSLGSPE